MCADTTIIYFEKIHVCFRLVILSLNIGLKPTSLAVAHMDMDIIRCPKPLNPLPILTLTKI